MGETAVADRRLRDLARAALAAYDVHPEAELRPIRTTNNAVFAVLIHGASSFVLRIHRPAYRTNSNIRSELHFLMRLAADLRGTRVSVPSPVAARNGDLVVEVAESRYCDLLTWVGGRVLKPGRGLGPRTSYLLGEGLARVHEAGRRFQAAEPALPRWDAQTLFSEPSPFRPGPMDEFLPAAARPLFQEVAELTRAAFAQLDRMPDSFGLIHADFVLINCHIVRGRTGSRLGILDFDDLGWGYLLYDLAPLLGNFADFPESYAMHRRACLAGYRSVRPLPEELEAYLPALMAARHATTLTWLAGMERQGRTDSSLARHVAYRVAAMRDCLELA
jgi:Ser/Thr protein kinase RdoA (MazF antagonist)